MLPTFGVGKDYGKPQWLSIFRQLHGAGLLALDITGYGRWTVTDAGRRVLKGVDRFALRSDILHSSRRSRGKAAIPAAAAEPSDADPALLDALKARRGELARERRVPAYVVFPDKSLIDMARRKPATAAEMAQVHGVGDAKLAQFGEIFLDVIRRHLAA
jgi:ATP-dependent DNA helicase RecQ